MGGVSAWIGIGDWGQDFTLLQFKTVEFEDLICKLMASGLPRPDVASLAGLPGMTLIEPAMQSTYNRHQNTEALTPSR